MADYVIKPIGIIHSPYKKVVDAPFQGGAEVSVIEVYAEYAGGLRDVEGFGCLQVFYWLHESKGYSLDVLTPWDAKSHGLFATRTPDRPNPIGYSLVELLDVEGNILKVRGLDAVEGTPVVDLKPYVPDIDSRSCALIGWMENKYGRM
ncbi:MAG: tRNA (N6-threonylcarbamoyladenosine(37)-N6)-methyltransferase TrmO [Candidatus Altiarchaeota archaeon]|nr:tRNA (N6-threonylcarbamoyladenosine(37)-N6)-methyltransferase TrmO [Candidatus Altiarchaeota archaeon]